MKRSSFDSLVLEAPGLRKLLQECGGCHRFGLKPGILTTKHGDYGWRQIAGKYPELTLNSCGLCPDCMIGQPESASDCCGKPPLST
jgi:hypothetical protein